MGKSLAVAGIQAAHLVALTPAARRFHRACARPQRTQLALLRELVRRNAPTAFGREHRLAEVGDLAAFRRRVPVRDYAGHAPWVDRAARGARLQLTAEPVLAFEPTSGSTHAQKLIPYTQGLLQDFSRATGPWLFDMLSRSPRLWGARSYWAVSAANAEARHTEAGIRIGLEDDTEYFGPLQRWAIRRSLAVDPRVGQLRDHGSWQQQTARQLLAAADLGFVSVWHPSYWVLLVRYMQEHLPRLIEHLPAARRRHLERHRHAPARWWPRLSLISCWGEGPAQSFVSQLHGDFPRARVQAKGLMATEGAVTIPLSVAAHPVAAIASHFLEFVDLQSPSAPPRLADELRAGADYRPLLTTSGGLYRYDLGDRVRCRGHYRRAPLLSFEGRCDRRSDLRGEKLDSAFVQGVLSDACAELHLTPTFLLLAPSEGAQPRYKLYVEARALGSSCVNALGKAVERRLLATHHYALCRRLGQLQAVRAIAVGDGLSRYAAERRRRGMREGNIKPELLATETFWGQVFEASAPGAMPTGDAAARGGSPQP